MGTGEMGEGDWSLDKFRVGKPACRNGESRLQRGVTEWVGKMAVAFQLMEGRLLPPFFQLGPGWKLEPILLWQWAIGHGSRKS